MSEPTNIISKPNKTLPTVIYSNPSLDILMPVLIAAKINIKPNIILKIANINICCFFLNFIVLPYLSNLLDSIRPDTLTTETGERAEFSTPFTPEAVKPLAVSPMS
ncbi:MAG: hypothetical protein ACI92O_000232 [Colwellia sp.]|jgi:hypothetical protein